MNRWARLKGSSGGIKRTRIHESTHESLSTQNTCGAGVPRCRQCWMLSSCLALRPCRTVLGDVLVVDLGGRGLVCTALFTPMEVSVPRYSASMFGSDSCPAREKYCSTLRSALGRQRCTFGQVVERIASFVNLFKCTYTHGVRSENHSCVLNVGRHLIRPSTHLHFTIYLTRAPS